MKGKKYLFGIFIFACGFASSVLLNYLKDSSIDLGSANTVRDDDFIYARPLLLCGASEQVEPSDFEDLKHKVETEIDSVSNESDVVSVYFRELNSGAWFSINENETFSPASLLKLPLFIAYLKKAESEPGLLNAQLSLSETNWNEGQNFQPKEPTVPGETYPIMNLLIAMLKDSDNNATIALNSALDDSFKNEIYTDLGLSIPPGNAYEQFMTAKEYSHFFRVLYNASYLNHSNSEEALEIMTTARFPEGLAGGLPDSTLIAEKFGERKLQDTDSDAVLYELHDCGIVYTETNPYLLCVMTKGTESFEHLSTLLQTISRAVYNEMISPRAENLFVVNS